VVAADGVVRVAQGLHDLALLGAQPGVGAVVGVVLEPGLPAGRGQGHDDPLRRDLQLLTDRHDDRGGVHLGGVEVSDSHPGGGGVAEQG